MNGKFLKHFAIIGIGSMLSMVLGFFTTPIITRIVDPADYGQYSVFTMYSSLLMVLCIGLDQSMVRYFYEDDRIEYKQTLLKDCSVPPIILTVAVSIAAILLYDLGLFKFEFNKTVLHLLCFYTLILVIYRFSLLLLRLQYKSKLYSFLSVLQKSVYILVALVLLFLTDFSQKLSLIVATVFAAVVCLIVSIFSEREIWKFRPAAVTFHNLRKIDLIKYGYPYIVTMGITSLFQGLDQLSLNYFCSYHEVGIYASTMTLVHVFNIVQTTFNTLWAPMAIEHYTNDKEDRSFFQEGNKIITVIMFFIGFSLILVKDVFAILLGEKYRQAAMILPFLIFNPIMYTISETTVSGLVFMKKSKMQVFVAAGACLTNLVGNYIFVPILGGKGAAISTGLSYIVFFALRTIFSNRYFYVDFSLKRFSILTVLAILYAFYNTFVKFNYLCVVFYVAIMTIMFALYKDTIIWGIKYLIDIFTNKILRR
mgnify:CR=1 FL=1